LPSKGICHRRAFGFQAPLTLSSKGLFVYANASHNASNYSIALTAATCSDLDSLLMQHPPTQPYQDSSDCKKMCSTPLAFIFQTSFQHELLNAGSSVKWAMATRPLFFIKNFVQNEKKICSPFILRFIKNWNMLI
jgi:hypothetical protein